MPLSLPNAAALFLDYIHSTRRDKNSSCHSFYVWSQVPAVDMQVGVPSAGRDDSLGSAATGRVRVEYPFQLRRKPVLPGHHVRGTGM